MAVRIELDSQLGIYHSDELIVIHRLQPASQGWVTVPGYHHDLWRNALQVERRRLDVYKAVATWS